MKTSKPPCFGDLDTVFPMRNDGLRHTPKSCFECEQKTECLKTAMKTGKGTDARHEIVDRAYDTGLIGFFERWSRKKVLHRLRETQKSE